MSKLFGTDGIRATANQFPMTAEVALRVGQAIVYSLLHERKMWQSSLRHLSHVGAFSRSARLSSNLSTQDSKIKVVIGKDTRRSGYMIETAIASGVCSMGGEAVLLGPLPTPGVAFVATSMRADAGIMISASHNPYSDNGIKIFGSDGFKASDEIENLIEELVAHPEKMQHAFPRGEKIGRAYRIDEAHGRYIEFLKSNFPQNYDLSEFKIALDCAHGAAYKAAPLAFQELGAEVFVMGVAPNGTNINDQVGALYPAQLSRLTVESGADLGIALDGDADRVILVDEKGEVVDGDVIIALCALQYQKKGLLKNNGIVTTPMSNVGMENTLKKHGIKMIRAAVGDRYVVEEMRKSGFTVGGEQSGHILFLDHSTTGDGTLAAFKMLEIMSETGKRLSELKREIELYPQVLLNIKVSEKKPLETLVQTQKLVQKIESELKDEGRVFIRYSGTEPKVRILLEGQRRDQIEQWANEISNSLQKELT